MEEVKTKPNVKPMVSKEDYDKLLSESQKLQEYTKQLEIAFEQIKNDVRHGVTKTKIEMLFTIIQHKEQFPDIYYKKADEEIRMFLFGEEPENKE